MSKRIWEINGLTTIAHHDSAYKIYLCGEVTGAEIQKMKIRIVEFTDNAWGIQIGMCCSSHPRTSSYYFGSNNHRGWGYNCGGRKNGLDYRPGFGIDYGKKYKKGDVITCIYNKGKNTIEYLVNEISQGVAFEKMIGNLNFAVCLLDDQKLELLPTETDFSIYQIDQKEAAKEEKQRLEQLIENESGDFEIKLKNKTLLLWKFLLFKSNIRKLKKIKKYDLDLKLDVTTQNVILTILGKKCKIATTEIFDYYIFFRMLGLKNEMFMILSYLKIDTPIKVLVQMLKRCSEYENEVVKSWFSDSPKKYVATFDTSFGLAVFNLFKIRENDINSKPENLLIPNFGAILFNLKKYREIKDLKKHDDFFDLIEKDFLLELYEERKFSNLKLSSSDDRLFEVHKEILILETNFFSRMLKFEYLEGKEAKEKGVISLQDLKADEVKYLLELIYLGETSGSSLTVIMNVINHCEMHGEEKHLSILFQRLSDLINEDILSKEEIEWCFTEFGHIFRNETIMKKGFPVFKKYFTKEEILKMIKKSIEYNDLNSLMDGVNKKMKMLQNQLTDVIKENNSLKKRVKKLEEKCKKL